MRTRTIAEPEGDARRPCLIFLIGAHAAVTGRPLLTRDPRRVATHIPGVTLNKPDA